MQIGRIFDVAMAIVAVGGLTVAVTSAHTSDVIKAFGSSFSGALKQAMGNK